MVANRIGGLAAGAFDGDGVLHGFVFGLTGVEDGALVHWSDMLAVRSTFRDRGLGTRLKHYQRDVLQSRGIHRMRWTFDPLQSRNAYVNFGKLGIVSGEYVRDMYGDTGSPLHRGIGTDRLIALWEMDSERVWRRILGEEEAFEGVELEALPAALDVVVKGPPPSPGRPVLGMEDPAVRMAIPGTLDAIVEVDVGLAVRWREATREVFLDYLTRGYRVTELLPRGEVSFYVLSR